MVSLVAPIAASQAAPVLTAPGDEVLQLYVTGDALGGVMTTELPTAEASVKKSLIATAINPGVGTTVVLGTFTPSSDLVFASDVLVSIWIVSQQATMHDQIQARIIQGGTTKATASTPLRPEALQTTATNIRIGLPARGAELEAGSEARLELVLFGASAAGTPTDMSILYGSAAHPTGLMGAVTGGDFGTSSSALPVYLAAAALSFDVPTGTDDLRADAPSTGCTGSCLALSGAIEWGKVVAPNDFVISGETLLTISVGINGNAGAGRQFTGTLAIGEKSFAHTMGIAAYSWSSATAVTTIRVSFATRGHEVKAGDEIKLSYALWSTTDTPAAKMQIVYGSVGRPSGLLIPTSGSGPSAPSVPLLEMVAASSALSGAAGEEISANVSITNLGSENVTVSLSSIGNATVAFPDGENVTVEAGNMSQVNFTVEVPDVEVGRSVNFTIVAKLGDVELGNVTFIVTVAAPESDAPVPTSSGSAPPSNTTADGTGSLKSQEAPEAVPGYGLPLLLVAFGLAVAVGTRRRD